MSRKRGRIQVTVKGNSDRQWNLKAWRLQGRTYKGMVSKEQPDCRLLRETWKKGKCERIQNLRCLSISERRTCIVRCGIHLWEFGSHILHSAIRTKCLNIHSQWLPTFYKRYLNGFLLGHRRCSCIVWVIISITLLTCSW